MAVKNHLHSSSDVLKSCRAQLSNRPYLKQHGRLQESEQICGSSAGGGIIISQTSIHNNLA
jgi:hypothetical protein